MLREVIATCPSSTAVQPSGTQPINKISRIDYFPTTTISRTDVQLYDLLEIAKSSTTAEKPYDSQARGGIEPGTPRCERSFTPLHHTTAPADRGILSTSGDS